MDDKHKKGCNCDNHGKCGSCFPGVHIPVGPQGPRGLTGPKGDKGDRGEKGDTGVAGPTGAAGANGTNGTNGATGAIGPKGDPGVTGAQGPIGATGATGASGLPGSQSLFGSGAPAPGLGVNGDVYFDTTTSYPMLPVYKKISGTWVLQGIFGNLVNPSALADNSKTFISSKSTPQNIPDDAVGTQMFFDQNLTAEEGVSDYWNGIQYFAIQSIAEPLTFILEGNVFENFGAGMATVSVAIYHQTAPFVVTAIASTTINVAAGSTAELTYLEAAGISVSSGNILWVKMAAGVGSNVKHNSGHFYNIIT